MNVADWQTKIWGWLPRGMFPANGPLINAVVTAIATVAAACSAQVAYFKAQTHLSTASDIWLDIIASDFLGYRQFMRRSAETDASYQVRISEEIMRDRTTRPAMSNAIVELTGNPCRIFEPGNQADTGAYDSDTFYYNALGYWGTKQMPYQCYIDVQRPKGEGIPYFSGYNDPQGGWGCGAFYYGSKAQITGDVPDAEIYSTVAKTVAAGCRAWVNIQSGPVE